MAMKTVSDTRTKAQERVRPADMVRSIIIMRTKNTAVCGQKRQIVRGRRTAANGQQQPIQDGPGWTPDPGGRGATPHPRRVTLVNTRKTKNPTSRDPPTRQTNPPTSTVLRPENGEKKIAVGQPCRPPTAKNFFEKAKKRMAKAWENLVKGGKNGQNGNREWEHPIYGSLTVADTVAAINLLFSYVFYYLTTEELNILYISFFKK